MEIDLFDEDACGSFIAFDSYAVRPGNVPAFAPLSIHYYPGVPVFAWGKKPVGFSQ